MKELTKEQLEAVRDLRSWNTVEKFDEILKLKGLLKEELEFGKWYIIENGIAFRKNDKDENYGIHFNEWRTDLFVDKDIIRREATDKEVEETLIKKFEKDGCHYLNYRFVKGLLQGTNEEVMFPKWSNWTTLFNNGKWASIITESKEDKANKILDEAIKKLNELRE